MKLLDSDILYLDCQTTGSAPPKACIIELGWSKEIAHQGPGEINTSLVALPEGMELPKRISLLTGISQDDLASAPAPLDLWQNLAPELVSDIPWVIHFAQFERPFLQAWTGIDSPKIFCTFEIARRLYPDLPSRSIRAVSGFIGHSVSELKRSEHHIGATQAIWHHLVEKLGKDFGVTTFEELEELLKTPVKKGGKKSYALGPDIRLKLPDKPGIYKMLSLKGDVLYVGKATSLRSRVNSYFRGRKTKGSRLNELTAQIHNIETIEVGSPLEAALVETDLIKHFNPPYNRALKKINREIAYAQSPHGRTLGPFSSQTFITHVGVWQAAVEHWVKEEMTDEDLSVLRTALQWTASVEPPGLDILREGLVLYQQRFLSDQEGDVDWTKIYARGWIYSIERTRQRRLEKLAAEQEVDLEGEEIEEDFEWTPEHIVSHIASSFMGFGNRVHRGRWFSRLTNCQLFWREESQQDWHLCSANQGILSFARVAAVNIDPSLAHKIAPSFDIDLYDRMQVLTMELRRLLREGCEVILFASQCVRPLDRTLLTKYMFPGEFDEED